MSNYSTADTYSTWRTYDDESMPAIEFTHSSLIKRDNSMVIVEQVQDDRQRHWATAGVSILAGTSIVVSLLAMYMEASYLVTCTFLIPLLAAPYTVHQRRQINKLPTLTHEINVCRELVNRLAVKNHELRALNQRLTQKIHQLASVQDRLAIAAERSGEDVDKLRKKIFENGQIQRQMQRLSVARDLQHLLSVILSSDRDNDNRFSEGELEEVVRRLQAFGNNPTVNSEGLKRALLSKQEHSLSELLQMTSSVAEAGCAVVEDDQDFVYVRCAE